MPKPSPQNAAVIFVVYVCIFSVYVGMAIDSATHIPETIRWDRECAKRTFATCIDGIVCKWSTVKDRCEGKDGRSTETSFSLVVTFGVGMVLVALGASIAGRKGEKEFQARNTHMLLCIFVGFSIVCFVTAVAFEDSFFTVVGVFLLAAGFVGFITFLKNVHVRMEYRVVVVDEEVGGVTSEEDDDASRSSSSGPGLFEGALDAAQVALHLKPELPSYDVVVGDSPIMDELLQ